MSQLIQASQLLDDEVQHASSQLDAEPGNILLAMRLARIQILASLCKTYGVAADIASGYIPVAFKPQCGMDERSNTGNELAGPSGSFTSSGACASERGQLSADELQGKCHQLSLELGTE